LGNKAVCTVIIPAYNAARFIERAIASARAQGSPEDVRIIVIDDGSADKTAEIVKAQDIAELVQQDNAGVSAARNAGLALSDSEYIIFLDADDELLPDALVHHRSAMDAHPDAAMVFGSNTIISETDEIIGSNPIDPFETRDFMMTALEITPCPSQVMVRRSVLVKAGGYNPALKGAEDCDLWLRLLQYGTIVCHGAFVMNYRRHTGQATGRPSKIFAQHLKMLEQRMADPSAPSDPASARKLKRKWQSHYGQYIPIEVVRLTAKGKLGEALSAARQFAGALPASATGAIRFASRKLASKS
jgi:glycosyltransferase involved in cell wall biosynthesis